MRLPYRRAVRLLVLLAVGMIGTALIGLATPAAAAEPARVEEQRLDGAGVALDTSLYLPATTPAPAVLVAHGFGGTKASVDADARDLAARGFVVLAWTARGFGASGGQIALDAPDAEVADARKLVDWLADPPRGRAGRARRPARGRHRRLVRRRAVAHARGLRPARGRHRPGDHLERPGAGAVPQRRHRGAAPGRRPRSAAPLRRPASFERGGGGRCSSAAPGRSAQRAAGHRADLRPVHPGRLRRLHRGRDHRADLAPPPPSCSPARPRVASPTGSPRPPCSSRASRTRCSASTRPTPTPARSPRPAPRSRSPGIRAGTTGEVRPGRPRPDRRLVHRWLVGGRRPRRTSGSPTPCSPGCGRGPTRRPDARSSRRITRASAAPPRRPSRSRCPATRRCYQPGRRQPRRDHVAARARWRARRGRRSADGDHRRDPRPDRPVPEAPVARAADGGGGAAGAVTVARVPGQPAPAEAVLFAGRRGRPGRTRTLLGSSVAPMRVAVPADGSATVTVTLPGVVAPIEAGNPLVRSQHRPGLRGRHRPGGRGGSASTRRADRAAGARRGAHGQHRAARARDRHRRDPVGALRGRGWSPAAAPPPHGRAAGPGAPPLAVADLAKTYKGGFSAVKGVSFTVERGMVLGLLGPNGAGKTTVLRMLMGLIRPTAGTITAFGEEVGRRRAGAGADRRVRRGARLPAAPVRRGKPAAVLAGHRPPAEEAHVAEALEIAGLGASIDRRVGTYSQGMRQRLAIAQAMLGLPELLVLDEPTNGLDPPQIHAMREVLQRLRRRRPHRAGVQPPAGRGRADLHARRGDAPRQGGGRGTVEQIIAGRGRRHLQRRRARPGRAPCSAGSTACTAVQRRRTARCTPS